MAPRRPCSALLSSAPRVSARLLAILLLPALAAAQDDVAWFTREVRPLLERACFECHGGGSEKGGLALDSREGLLRGGDAGPVVDLERAEDSLLLAKISYRDEHHRMPPSGRLEDDEVALLREWLGRGAPHDVPDSPSDSDRESPPGRDDGMEGWALRPVRRPAVPAVRERERVLNPVDSFVLARLESAGLPLAPEADRRTLVRRATFDLLGLPPTPEEVDAFVADPRPDAWERLVERLLSSPHYGEKWGRHWLDLVRYADTNGYERDADKPFIWRYRDWVIRALNEDMPYDRFVVHQLAGDEIDRPTADSVVATGYHRLMVWDDEPGQGELQARYDVLDDLVSTTAQVFLGTTIGCARCHDHKGDPISQVDYYSFMAFFQGVTDMTREGYLTDVSSPEARARYARAATERRRAEEGALGEMKAIEEEFRVAAERVGSARLAGDLDDLRYRFHRGAFTGLPDFDALRPETEGALEGGLFSLAPATRREDIGFVQEGRLLVGTSGRRVFHLETDEPARLTIDGRALIEPDTPRQGRLAVAAVDLEEGLHDLRIEFVQRRPGRGLKLRWTPDPRSPWRIRRSDPGSGWADPGFDDSTWEVADGGFGTPGTPGAVVGTRWDGEALWLRRTFEWAGAEDPVLVLHHDEDVEVLINGRTALERRGYLTGYRIFDLDAEARAILTRGPNLLAIRVRQSVGGQYVDAAVVSRRLAENGRLEDLALGLRALSVDAAGSEIEDPVEALDARGAALIGAERVARHRALREELARLRARPLPPRTLAAAVQETGPHPEDLHVHVRGNASTPGARVEPAFPAALSREPPRIPEPSPGAPTSGRRRALAEWIASPGHPLTARVAVNRIWQHHFGRGIVRSPNDFGELGERPTHPELLDWLAAEFVASGWSLKAMHRLLMGSSAYRASGAVDAETLRADPRNDLFSRFGLRRLTAEELRDAAIAVTGRLNPKMGGPGFFSSMPEEALATSSRPDEVWGESSAEERARRSIYVKVKRSLITPVLGAFDLADTDASCPERFVTVHPGQALEAMNGPFLRQQSSHFAERLLREAPDDRGRIELAIRLTTGRRPGGEEVAAHLEFLEEMRRDFGLGEAEVASRFALLLLNTNEFNHLD